MIASRFLVGRRAVARNYCVNPTQIQKAIRAFELSQNHPSDKISFQRHSEPFKFFQTYDSISSYAKVNLIDEGCPSINSFNYQLPTVTDQRLFEKEVHKIVEALRDNVRCLDPNVNNEQMIADKIRPFLKSACILVNAQRTANASNASNAVEEMPPFEAHKRVSALSRDVCLVYKVKVEGTEAHGEVDFLLRQHYFALPVMVSNDADSAFPVLAAIVALRERLIDEYTLSLPLDSAAIRAALDAMPFFGASTNGSDWTFVDYRLQRHRNGDLVGRYHTSRRFSVPLFSKPRAASCDVARVRDILRVLCGVLQRQMECAPSFDVAVGTSHPISQGRM